MKLSITALFVLIGAAAASENVVENGLRGSDSATRELYKKGGGSQGNGGGAGAKEQTWSCEAVNAKFEGDDIPNCGNNGGKQYNLQKAGAVGDTCQPCCLCGNVPINGVCSILRAEGATEDSACPAGIPLGSAANCDAACGP